MVGRVFPSIRNNPPSLRHEIAIAIFLSGPRYTKIAFQDIMPLNVAWRAVQAVEGGVEMRLVERVVQGWTLCGVKFFWSWNLRGHIFFFGTAGHFLGEKWKSPLFSIPTIHVAWRIGKRLDFHWEWLRMHNSPVQRWKFVIKTLQNASSQEGMLWTEPFATKKINCFPIPQLKSKLKLAKYRWIQILYIEYFRPWNHGGC